MRRRLVSRLAAVLVAIAVTASGACIQPRSASAAHRCCAKACHHDGRATMTGCCCTPRSAPAVPATVASAAPTATCPVIALGTVTQPVPPGIVATAFSTHPPPGGPLFLQRCTLLL